MKAKKNQFHFQTNYVQTNFMGKGNMNLERVNSKSRPPQGREVSATWTGKHSLFAKSVSSAINIFRWLGKRAAFMF